MTSILSSGSPKLIGRRSAETGDKVPTIWSYEWIGLGTEPSRTADGRRPYDAAVYRRFAFFKHARLLNFDLDAIRSLLDLSDQLDRPCAESIVIAGLHLVEFELKMERLKTCTEAKHDCLLSVGTA